MNSNYSSDKVVTLQKMWNETDIEAVGVTAVISVLVGGLTTAMLASTLSLFFLLLALVPISAIAFSFTIAFKHTLNDIVNSFSHYSDSTKKAFNNRETFKVLLRIPFNKSLTCGTYGIPSDRYDNSVIRGVQTYHVENIKGKIHMIKDYQEDPGYRWDETFETAKKKIRGMQ